MNNKNFPPGMDGDNIVAIDFDGVIHNSDKGWFDGTCYGEPIPGVLRALKEISESYKIVIFSAKAKSDRPLVNNKTGIELIKEWLVNYNLDKYVSDIVSDKPRAILYIDDNGYRFNNWEDTLKFMTTI